MLTKTHAFLGTAEYASPEQCHGRAVDHRTDIFALGVVFYEMLTGERPFQGDNTVDLMFAINHEAPKPLEVSRSGLPGDLRTIVGRMLEKRSEDRYQTMEDVLTALLRSPAENLDSTATMAAVATGPDSGPPAPGSERTSIAVLRFRSLSNDPDDEFLAAGISSEIIRALSGIPGTRIPSQLAAFRARAQQEGMSLKDTARELSCKYILTGTLRRSGNRIRVTTELTDAVHETLLWSHRYDRMLEDVFAVQDEIASAIAGATGGQIIRTRSEEASATPAERLDAWGLVRRAYHWFNQAYHVGAIDVSLDCLRRAISIQPNYAVAHAFLGMLLTQRMINFISPDASADFAEVLVSVDRALELSPSDPEVLEHCGLALFNCTQSERSMRVLRRAVEIAPFNMVAWGYLALCLGWTSDNAAATEGRDILDRILKTAPDHPSLPYWLFFKAGTCSHQENYAEAAVCASRSAEIQPRFPHSFMEHANALGMLGKEAAAREAVAKVSAMNPRFTQETYSRLLMQQTGSPERAEPHLRGLYAAGIYSK